MVTPQIALVFLTAYMNKVAKFDYRRLIPRGRVDHYSYGVVGVELTAPWGKEGLGLGLGLGVVDLWLGWPKVEENLHYVGCKHVVIGKQPGPVDKELQPADS